MKLLNGPTAAPRGRLAGIAIVGLALVLVGYWQTGDVSDDSDPEAGAIATASAEQAGVNPGTQASFSGSYAFAQRAAQKMTSNLFAVQSWYVPPPPPPPRPATVVVPTAPPLPFAFLGSYARGNEKPVFFLTRGDVVYDVHAGDTIDNTYLVEGVENGTLIFTYQPLKQRQSLFVGN